MRRNMKAIEKYNWKVENLCYTLNKEIVEEFVADEIHWTFIGEKKNPKAKVLVAFFDEDEDGFYQLIEMPSAYELYNNQEFVYKAMYNSYIGLLKTLCSWNGINFDWKDWSWKLAFDLCDEKKIEECYLTDDKVSYDVIFTPMVNVTFDAKETSGLDDEETEAFIIQKAIDKILESPRDYITFDNFDKLKEYEEF